MHIISFSKWIMYLTYDNFFYICIVVCYMIVTLICLNNFYISSRTFSIASIFLHFNYLKSYLLLYYYIIKSFLWIYAKYMVSCPISFKNNKIKWQYKKSVKKQFSATKLYSFKIQNHICIHILAWSFIKFYVVMCFQLLLCF